MKYIIYQASCWVSTALLFLLASCHPQVDALQKGPSDDKLEALLKQTSNNIGNAFFRLPESTEYDQIPQDPRNPLSDAKVNLGKLLFHETALGRKPVRLIGFGTYSCSSCHNAKAGFQACLPQGMGEGGEGFGVDGKGRRRNVRYEPDEIDALPLRPPTTLNVAFQTNMLWAGRLGATHANVGTEAFWAVGTPMEKNKLGFQGVETESIAAQDVHRLDMRASAFQGNHTYRQLFQLAFKDNWTNDYQTKINAGLAIAAYTRTALTNKAPFQLWLRGNVQAMTDEQKQGAILFFGKAGCVRCHTGPALNSMRFYSLGMNSLRNGTLGEFHIVKADPSLSDHKGRGGFTGKAADMYKFKVPQLYNLKDSPFYGHGGSFTSLEAIVDYLNKAIPENKEVPVAQLATEFKPLNLTASEQTYLVTFLRDGLRDPDLRRYAPSSLPSGQCFPNNDQASRQDLGF
ncbi:cytochrome-c peroxidase [Spirosoma oryzicola]|uniref:cytochrome-c peroxidase n=1 Tax=Spirosoma oryzicola TaxID=2898794 RepID=UPI001E2AF9A7|nr:cytochrome c peroxidase [Spirosoma oryzicola]UHG93068.1 cytochrome-c peroxidase [Spirosoma oryzicola]